MASTISQSSVATVIDDLVSDRNIGLKIFMIGLNCLQLISSWIAVCYFFVVIQEWTAKEVTVSIIFLVVGNYIIPGIANGIIYWRRWNRSSIAYRRRTQEENKQAWACLRITLSLLGIPTVGRYIETIIVSQKLKVLEKKHLQTSINVHRENSILSPIGTSRLESIINQKKYEQMSKSGRSQSLISGDSQQSKVNGIINETYPEKVRRARRQYKRCEHDGAQMALISGCVGAGPFVIALGILYLQRIEKVNMSTDQGAAVIISSILNVLWLCAALTHYYPARNVRSEAEFERGIGTNSIASIILLFISHIFQVVSRIICFVIFANYYFAFVLIIISFHWLVGTMILIVYRLFVKPKTVDQPMISCKSFLNALFLGYVGIFDFVNGNEGKTRLRYLVYYGFYYMENVAMLVIWVVMNPKTQIQFPLHFVIAVLSLFWIGFLFLQIYLYFYTTSPNGSSIIVCCNKNLKYSNSLNYAEEVREPIFGAPLFQSAVPLWRRRQFEERKESCTSEISDDKYKIAMHLHSDRNKTPSIMSILSTRSPGSIQSANIEKSRFQQTLSTPPVMKQKFKTESLKPSCNVDLSSDSSSLSSDELMKFTPKPKRDSQSLQNFENKIVFSSSLSDHQAQSQDTNSTVINDEAKIVPVPSENRVLKSKSLDRSINVYPTVQPNMHTKPIGLSNPTKLHVKKRNPYKRRINSAGSDIINMRKIIKKSAFNY